MKILNLFAGIGGNRRLWGNDHEITAVEFDERIAAIYRDLYPDDTLVIGDAHQYLLDHSHEFDFVWCSPPCPTHSRLNFTLNAQGNRRYPNMMLYQEIIYLQHFFKGIAYVVENVKSYYEPLIKPQYIGRHYFWSNLELPRVDSKVSMSKIGQVKCTNEECKAEIAKLGFPDLSKYKYPKKATLYKNCVDPNVGKAILEEVEKYSIIF